MKIIINRKLILDGIREGYVEEWKDTLNRLDIPYHWSHSDNDTFRFYLNPDGKKVMVNLSDEDMKIFLNTIEAHTTYRIKYIYLGNMRFEAVFDNS